MFRALGGSATKKLSLMRRSSLKRKSTPDPAQPGIEKFIAAGMSRVHHSPAKKNKLLASELPASSIKPAESPDPDMEELKTMMLAVLEQTKSIPSIQTKVDSIDLKIDRLEVRVVALEKGLTQTQQELQTLKQELENLKRAPSANTNAADVQKCEKIAQDLDRLQRRNNLVARGLPELHNETNVDLCAQSAALHSELGVPECKPILVSRVGASRNGAARPVRLVYNCSTQRDIVWGKRYELRNSTLLQNVYVDADLTYEARKAQYEQRQARRNGNPNPSS